MSTEHILFYVPGYRPGYIEQAMVFNIKDIIFCLEDGTPEDKKVEARFLVKRALKEFKSIDKNFIVRINGYGTEHWKEDLKSILPYAPKRIRLPMIRKVEEFIEIDKFINQFCAKNMINETPKYEIMIENKSMLDNLINLIKCSDKIYAFTIGGEDYYEDAKTYSTEPEKEVIKAKEQIASFCKQNKIFSFDTTYMDHKNERGFYENCVQSKQMGFSGRSIIHPLQVKTAREVY